MSNCVTDCCKNKKERKYCKYEKTLIGKFGNIKGGMTKDIFVCLGSEKAHNGCKLENTNDSMFICQNNNSDKEIGIFLKLDKKDFAMKTINNLCNKCEDIYIVFIFDIDEQEDVFTYKKVKEKLQKKCTKNIFGIKQDGFINIRTLKE